MAEPEIYATEPMAVELAKDQTYYWCTCGKSAQQPYCDGSHKGSDFTPLPFNAEQGGQAYLCACRQTSNPPYCDGSHKKISS